MQSRLPGREEFLAMVAAARYLDAFRVQSEDGLQAASEELRNEVWTMNANSDEDHVHDRACLSGQVESLRI